MTNRLQISIDVIKAWIFVLLLFHAVVSVQRFGISILHSPIFFQGRILVVLRFSNSYCLRFQIFSFFFEFFKTSQQLAIMGTTPSILFLVRDSCCLVIFEFCLIFQIFVFVSRFSLYLAIVSHQGNLNFHFKASILFCSKGFLLYCGFQFLFTISNTCFCF